MRHRLAQLGAVVTSLVALVGSTSPPAQAITTFEVAFTGFATYAVGLGYPCVGPGGTIDLALCPTNKGITIATDLPLPHDPIPQPLVEYNHNRQGFSVSSTTCVIMDTNINKLTKAPVHVNAGCSFGSAPSTKPDDNTVAGNCGLSSGQFRVNLNDGLGQIITLDFHIIEAVEVVIEGHWFKPATGQNGLLVGRLDATPPTPSSGQSCFSKTARDFLLTGMVTGITNPIPL